MNSGFRTHYDNLKVSRSAPPEVITAAYRALSKQLHPDRNQGDPLAERAMKIVNLSYAVLSDAEKRNAHDEWIEFKENESVLNDLEAQKNHQRVPQKSQFSFGRHITDYWLAYAICGFLAFAIFGEQLAPSKSGLPQYVANPTAEVAEGNNAASVAPAYQRPSTAPNGKKWPTDSLYINGYPIARNGGLSELTIDNSSNSTDMFVKLVALDSNKTVPVRHAFISANQSFTMNRIKAGRYDVRYMDLSDGSLSRSESFVLEEIHDLDGTRFSVTKMTLYKIANGNMQTYSLAPSEF